MKNQLIGGQAVIEGVMMKGDNHYAVSVWKGNKIRSISKKIRKYRFKLLYQPFIRGFFQLVQILIIGINALIWSTNQQSDDDEEFTYKELFFLLLTSLFFGILFFIVLPLYLTKLFNFSSAFVFNLVDGLFRVCVFIIYLAIISSMADIKRLFQYHGAEHKAVNCYEAGLKVNVPNCKKFSTAHPRCGTSFILIVLAISIIVFSFITYDSFLVKFLGRVVLIPIIAGIAYEALKLSARFRKNVFFRMLIAPGLWLQRLTTKEPDEKQLKTAVEALNLVVRLEKREAKS